MHIQDVGICWQGSLVTTRRICGVLRFIVLQKKPADTMPPKSDATVTTMLNYLKKRLAEEAFNAFVSGLPTNKTKTKNAIETAKKWPHKLHSAHAVTPISRSY